MKLPNGYGSVYKLSGRRRKPFGARVTIGWIEDPNSGKIKQKYKILGYYETRAQALQALAKYHEDPCEFNDETTFATLYQRWAEEKFPKISYSNVKTYKAAYKICSPLYEMKFSEIKRAHLQSVVDQSGKNYPTLQKLKLLYSQLYTYAIQNDVCEKNYAQYVDLSGHKQNPNAIVHKDFSSREIDLLWENKDSDAASIALILVYSGVRISELLNLRKADIHFNKRYFDVRESKTQSGIRKVPISEKVAPLFFKWLFQTKGEYLLGSVNGKPIKYMDYRKSSWDPLMQELGIKHLPHDTRHTTVSMLTRAEVSPIVIKRIVGHSNSSDVTEHVYTHLQMKQLVDAINKI